MTGNPSAVPAGKNLQKLLRHLTPVQAACAAGVLLLLGNLSYLANPPFWDDILGLHRQALFLARHHFNFVELMYSGDFWSGGAWIYKWNWPSVLYGALYSFLPPVAVHIFGHILNIAVLAASAGCVFKVLRLNGIAPAASLLWSLGMVCEPVLSAQGASLGQEILLAGCFCGFLLAFSLNRVQMGFAFLLLGAWIKPAAVIPAAAFCAVTGVEFLRDRSRVNLAKFISGGLFFLAFTILVLMDSDGASGNVWKELPERIRDMWLHFPLLLILAVSGMVCGTVRLIREGWDREYLLWLLWAAAFFAAYMLYSVPLPRYTAGVVPVCILLAARSLPRTGYAAFGFLLAGILLQGGAFHRPLPGHLRYSGEFLERDRSFLKQVALDQEVCARLEKECAGKPVVAKWPYVQMLADPGYGYVQKGLENVFCAGILPKKMENVKKYPDPELAKTRGVYYIFVCNSFEFFQEFGVPLAPRKGDTLVWMPEKDRSQGMFLVYRR